MSDDSRFREVTGLRVLNVYVPTDLDRAKVEGLSPSDCPRRYCWWWRSLSLEWDVPVKDGCTFLSAAKRSAFRNADIPCCRCDPSSLLDHLEPREPHLLE